MNLLPGLATSRRLTTIRTTSLCGIASRLFLAPASSGHISTSCLTHLQRHHSHWPASRPALHHRGSSIRFILPLETRRTLASERGDGIIINFEDLPPEYRDGEGLPFRETDLTNAEVQKVFGRVGHLRMKDANALLRILHGRRVAGTLDDPVFFRHTSRYTAAQKEVALEFLRRTTPVDEVFNAGLRAQEELEQLGQELGDVEASTPESRNHHAAADPSQPAEKPVYEPDPVYGHSVVAEIRAKNIAKREAEEKLRKEQEEREERERAERGPAHPGTLMALEERKDLSPRMKTWIENASSQLKEPPRMSNWERLGPSAVLVAVVVGLCGLLAAYYTPPPRPERLFPDVPPAAATVLTLIGLNVAVWAAWRVPPLWAFLNRYFVLVHGLPRPITLVTATFSHADFGHLAGNMLGLWFLGTRLHDDVGRGAFLAVYLSSGALGFLGSLAWLTTRGFLTASGVGASASVYGVFGAYFWLHRFDAFKIFGLPPPPLEGVDGLGFIGLVVALHLAAMGRKGKQTIDLVSHLAGISAGIGWMSWLERRMKGGSGGGGTARDGIAARDRRWTVDLWTRASQPLVKEQDGKSTRKGDASSGPGRRS